VRGNAPAARVGLAGRDLARKRHAAARSAAASSASQRQRPRDSLSSAAMYSRCAASSAGVGSITPTPGRVARNRGGDGRRHVDGQRFLPPRHRQVDLGQQLRVEQRAVHRPMRVIDAEPLAQRVEAVALAREHLARQGERVDHARMNGRAAVEVGKPQLGVEKADVERRVVDDPLGATSELGELGGDVAKSRLALQILPGHAVDLGRAGVDLALGVEAEMERAPGRATVDDLQRGEFDDPVALLRIEPRRFGVDDDLAHSGVRPRGAEVGRRFRKVRERGRAAVECAMIRRTPAGCGTRRRQPRRAPGGIACAVTAPSGPFSAGTAEWSSGFRRSRVRSRRRRGRGGCPCDRRGRASGRAASRIHRDRASR